MKIWQNRQTRINILFALPFVLAVIVAFGLNVYKHLHYSTFTLVIKGDYSVSSSNGQLPVHQDTSTGNISSLLRTAWWIHSPNYTLNQDGKVKVGPFWGYPTIAGNLDLTNWRRPRGNTSYVLFTVETMSGTIVNYMRPNHWYRIGETEPYAIVEFHWGK